MAGVRRLFLLLTLFAAPAIPAFAQLPIPSAASPPPSAEDEMAADPYGRETPRGTL